MDTNITPNMVSGREESHQTQLEALRSLKLVRESLDDDHSEGSPRAVVQIYTPKNGQMYLSS